MRLRFDFSEVSLPLLFEGPSTVLTAYTPQAVVPTLRAVQKAVAEGAWAAGFICYEAASGIDPAWLTHPNGRLPLLAFGIYHAPQAPTMAWSQGSYGLGSWRCLTDAPEYQQAFAAIQEAIRQGLTYQVNYSVRMETEFEGDPQALYSSLQTAQQGAYGAYAEWENYALVSASPELFFRVDGRTVTARPMKGTIRRGRFLAEDEALRTALAQSPKDRAENIMIVDLIRNDLGKVARLGTVVARDVFSIERFPTVYQMTSTVSAELSESANWLDVLLALFPCGSITGAPKSSTMRIIRDLESGPRGIYCGTLGYIAPGGDAVFNVAIRTVTLDFQAHRAEFSAGGGITSDSAVGLEYAEVQTKSQFLQTRAAKIEPFSLLETLRLSDGRYWLLEEHLARLRASARWFGWPWAEGPWERRDPSIAASLTTAPLEEEIRSRLAELSMQHPLGAFRVRLLVDAQGRITVESTPLVWHTGIAQVAWAADPISDDPNEAYWLFHKTTVRHAYQGWHPPASPLFDHLLWDSHGHATEFTRGNLVAEIDGHLVTPPIACGLLAGTLRQWLVQHRFVEEAAVTRGEVESARYLWFVNSVQGWVPVSLTDDS
jgi:para-aminobenzoate synthetase/4-amino-4-deoxychorismate lyase